MRRYAAWALIWPVLAIAQPAAAEDLFSAISVPQATGYSDVAMTLDDTMLAAKQLASGLTKSTSRNGNTALILQVGSYNTAQVDQASGRNLAFVAQSGAFNTASVQQKGVSSQSIVVQRGTGNTALTTQR